MNQAIVTEQIFDTSIPFEEKAMQVFRWQAYHCPIYKQYLKLLKINTESIISIDQIPFLPIQFFKTFDVVANQHPIEKIFTSSATTGAQVSRHLVTDLNIYDKSFTKGFEKFYGNMDEYCILALLPNYLERYGSSLVYMVEQMMAQSKHPLNGFFLYDFESLKQRLIALESIHQKTLLIGVTFALLDFSEHAPTLLKNTIIMETGGMKGRKKELLRHEVHTILQAAFGVPTIHSEYGMTELLSQAYSKGDGIFECQPWMKIVVKDMYDPFQNLSQNQMGQIGAIDLANINSCSFILTDDMGAMMDSERFTIAGRKDNSDVRGCNLMVL